MTRQITIAPIFSAWQQAARRALAENLPPDEIAWEELDADQPSLGMFDEEDPPAKTTKVRAGQQHRVPKEFMEIARRVACHRDPRRWGLLYRVLWRITHGERKLLEIAVDPDIHELSRLDKAVRHDVHKMRAFVRFRKVPHEGSDWYVAWFEPEHHIVELNASFFRDRFASMHWSILTPDRCVHWDGERLSFTEGVAKSEAPGDDAMEALWRNYYGSIFNPARVKVKAMQKEMPKRYWKNLPEAEIIPALLEAAPRQTEIMLAEGGAPPEIEDVHTPAQPPSDASLSELRKAAHKCRACPLWRDATQTVFGEGPAKARLVIVGEQPGDSEDREGHPFVGPAGRLLDDALKEAGISREKVYVTNAVKHFKWEARGKRRLHKTPNSRDIAACRPWLEAEIVAIQPELVICLGATAAQTLLGPDFRVTRQRGEFFSSPFAQNVMATVHPSSILRAPDETRHDEMRKFIRDLKKASDFLQ